MNNDISELESYVSQLLNENPVSQELTQYIVLIESEYAPTGELEVDKYNLDCIKETIESLLVPDLDWEE